jgi:hypothetical protein
MTHHLQDFELSPVLFSINIYAVPFERNPGIAPLKIFCSEFSRLISSHAEEHFGHFPLTISQTGKRTQEELVTKG